MLRKTAQILVSVRADYDDFETVEHPVDICSMRSSKTGENWRKISNKVMRCTAGTLKFPLHKMVRKTKYSSPLMDK
jgi:hypothetical protein